MDKSPINETSLEMFGMRRAMQPYVGILYSMARWSPTGNILEIGVRQGQSTRTILGALADRGSGRLTSIDVRDRTDRIPEELRPHWRHAVGDSHSQDVYKEAAAGMMFDLILIDGDHSASGVRKDWEMYAPHVSPGGFVIFHDIINPNDPEGGVKAFWDDFGSTLGEGRVSLTSWPGLAIVQIK